MNRRLAVFMAVVVALAASAYLAVRLYDVEFLGYIVKRTLLEMRAPDVDPHVIEGRFSEFDGRLRDGGMTRDGYRQALMEAASDMEKISVVRTGDLARIWAYFDKGRTPQ